MSIDFGNDIYEEPIVAKTFLAEDAQESSLRPKTLAEYIGQEKAKENLSIFIQAARKRQESLDHVLLHGPPGLGKTTLAGIIAQEMGVNIRITSGPAIEKPGDLAALLTNLNEGDILFVDEIHQYAAQDLRIGVAFHGIQEGHTGEIRLQPFRILPDDGLLIKIKAVMLLGLL